MTKVCFMLIKNAENFPFADPKLNLPEKRSNVSLLPSIHVLLKPALLLVPVRRISTIIPYCIIRNVLVLKLKLIGYQFHIGRVTTT